MEKKNNIFKCYAKIILLEQGYSNCTFWPIEYWFLRLPTTPLVTTEIEKEK